FGFNFLRVHIKIDDPLLLYWADKLGILLMADFPNFGEGGDTPLGRRRFETMMREGIERDFNHPSIFAWCLFNETWGFGGQNELIEHLLAPPTGKNLPAGLAPSPAEKAKKPAAGERPGMLPPQAWVQQCWELAKQLDPTRLVEDMSVCHWDHLEYYLHCDTDINSWHFYISDYDKAKAHIDKIVNSTFVGSSFNYVPGFLHKGQPLINSEYGGVGALDGDRDVSWSFKFLTNELRRHQQVAAYIYTELHDVEWEYNGFLNYDRTPKDFGYDPRIINESNTLPIDSAPIRRVMPGEVVRLEVASSHYSTRKYENVFLDWRMGGIDTRGRMHQDLACGRVPIPFTHRHVVPAHTIELRMPETSMLCTLLVTAVASDGQTIAENFVQFYVSPGYPPDREDTPRALVLRGAPANWARAEWSGGTGEREKERAEDSCFGFGHGFFEWVLPLGGADLHKARRLRVLCEASAHRIDAPQTDEDIFPTTLRISLNDVRLYEAVLRNHPHDARGVLSYLRGGLGAYGYPAFVAAEGDQLQEILRRDGDGHLRLSCEVPADAIAQGGLTIYGAECGRFPVCPTVVVEW
ncbi:MAG TPA: glycoside hydrolase family 2, partial [Clostridia bacterium]|nr:glycoside hydrolase family 2 [Clostridia bacterium]